MIIRRSSGPGQFLTGTEARFAAANPGSVVHVSERTERDCSCRPVCEAPSALWKLREEGHSTKILSSVNLPIAGRMQLVCIFGKSD